MKVVILAGGLGTRISEESIYKPKPMIEIGNMPILWHIMKEYSYYGFHDFVICAGYKQHMIKEWFADYFLHTSDITFDFTRGQNEMIISIMLNYVATLFMGVLYTSWIRDASVPQTPAVDDLVKLPRVITGMRFTWGFVIAVVVGLVLYYVLFWTSGGFKLRAVGYNMTASRFNGIHVKRCMLTSFIISGAIAGLGGGAELLGTQFRLINGFGAGYGFDGVAMALIGQLHPIAAAQIQRQGAPRPRCGQDELQPVHPLGVLCAKVQPVRPGHKFGAAALLLKDFDLHAKPPFLFAVPIVPPGAQNYPVCTKNVKFSVLRHFAKRGFGTGNASFSPLPGPGNSPAGFPCKTRDVGQLVLGAAAAAAALFAEKRAGANVKNS